MHGSNASSSASVAVDVAAIMQIAGLSKRYGDQRALADISFSLNAGEVLGLIGPNGAGKTTLMEAIAGVSRSTTAPWSGMAARFRSGGAANSGPISRTDCALGKISTLCG